MTKQSVALLYGSLVPAKGASTQARLKTQQGYIPLQLNLLHDQPQPDQPIAVLGSLGSRYHHPHKHDYGHIEVAAYRPWHPQANEGQAKAVLYTRLFETILFPEIADLDTIAILSGVIGRIRKLDYLRLMLKNADGHFFIRAQWQTPVASALNQKRTGERISLLTRLVSTFQTKYGRHQLWCHPITLLPDDTPEALWDEIGLHIVQAFDNID